MFSRAFKNAKIEAAEVEMTAQVTHRFLIVLFAASIFHTEVFGQEFQDGVQAIEITDSADLPVDRDTEAEPSQAPRRPQAYTPARVGRRAAVKYMAPKRPDGAETESEAPARRGPAAGTTSDHYLAIHVGSFLSDNAYKWGAPDNQSNVGSYNFGVTYRMGEWVNSMDLLFRFDVSRMNLAEGGVTKFGVLPLITFPDASSRFPLYFGAGIGLGVFGNQIAGESALTLDYQLLGGARFFNVWGETGIFVEGGIKNHLFLFSDGQFNGTFIATGLVFTF